MIFSYKIYKIKAYKHVSITVFNLFSSQIVNQQLFLNDNS